MSIAISCFTYSTFFYKGGHKWKVMSYVFLGLISPFYLRNNPDFPFFELPDLGFLLIWIVLIPIGVYVLVRNLKISAYYAVLNSIQTTNKEVPKNKRKLSRKLNMFEKLTVFLFATIGVSIISLSLHESLEIFQFPLQFIGTFCAIIIAGFYYISDKNSLKRKIRVVLITFLSSFYLIMGYSFLNMILYLTKYFSINLFDSMVYSTIVLAGFFLVVEGLLLSLKSTIISSERNKSVGEIFSKIFVKNTVINLLLILIFSDSIVLYNLFLEESIMDLIIWTGPFILFISGFYLKSTQIVLEFKNQIGLIEQTDLEQEFNALIG